eukprot:242476_1
MARAAQISIIMILLLVAFLSYDKSKITKLSIALPIISRTEKVGKLIWSGNDAPNSLDITQEPNLKLTYHVYFGGNMQFDHFIDQIMMFHGETINTDYAKPTYFLHGGTRDPSLKQKQDGTFTNGYLWTIARTQPNQDIAYCEQYSEGYSGIGHWSISYVKKPQIGYITMFERINNQQCKQCNYNISDKVGRFGPSDLGFITANQNNFIGRIGYQPTDNANGHEIPDAWLIPPSVQKNCLKLSAKYVIHFTGTENYDPQNRVSPLYAVFGLICTFAAIISFIHRVRGVQPAADAAQGYGAIV